MDNTEKTNENNIVAMPSTFVKFGKFVWVYNSLHPTMLQKSI